MLKKFFAIVAVALSASVCSAQPIKLVPEIDKYCPGQITRVYFDKVGNETVVVNAYICSFKENTITLACGANRNGRFDVKVGEAVQCPEDKKLNYILKSVDAQARKFKLDFEE